MKEMESLISQVPSSYVINVTAHNVTPQEIKIIKTEQLSTQVATKIQDGTNSDVQQ